MGNIVCQSSKVHLSVLHCPPSPTPTSSSSDLPTSYHPAVIKMLSWMTEWVWKGVGGVVGDFGARGVELWGGRRWVPTHCWVLGKRRERESAAGREVFGSAPIVGVSASTFSSSWVPTVGMAALPSLWPLDRGPLLACFHHPFWFILFFSFSPLSSLYFGNGFITAKTEMFHNWFVKAIGYVCDQTTSGMLSLLCFLNMVQLIIHLLIKKKKLLKQFYFFWSSKKLQVGFLSLIWICQISKKCIKQKKWFTLFFYLSDNRGFPG